MVNVNKQASNGLQSRCQLETNERQARDYIEIREILGRDHPWRDQRWRQKRDQRKRDQREREREREIRKRDQRVTRQRQETDRQTDRQTWSYG